MELGSRGWCDSVSTFEVTAARLLSRWGISTLDLLVSTLRRGLETPGTSKVGVGVEPSNTATEWLCFNLTLGVCSASFLGSGCDMVDVPLMLLLTELEKAELRDALGDGVVEELESSEERSRSSKLRTGRMVDDMRLGTGGEAGADDRDLPLTPLAAPLDIVSAAACGTGDSLDRDGLRPCSRPESFDEFSFGDEEACAGS